MSATPNSHQEAQKKRSAVQPDEIVAHLRILAVFHKLKLDVQARSPHNPTGLWTAFLGYAVEKFASWITNVIDKEDGKMGEELEDDEFPTLDVAMVWHAYILNPLEYHRDCQKSHSGLMRIKAFPVKRLADVIDTLGLEPRFPVPAFGSRGVRIGPQFSLDLVAAVKRQASFVAQVAAVGWTMRPRGIQDTATCCIDKYHGFLKKLWENPNHLAVPTLEIDLAWHTHQLNIEQYRKDSMMLFGRILQHDDDIPSPELNKAFKRNSYDWQNLFHMDYSSGSICTGFRPVSLSTPGTPNSKRPSSFVSSRTNSEISLQELYQAVSEKRLSGGADGSSRASSSSVSTPSGSPSPPPSIQSLTPASRPSSAGDDSPQHTDSMMQMLRPGNDSTTTISPQPPSNGNLTPTPTLSDSRRSSNSDLGSIFAYTASRGWNDSRGAFDRPPVSCLKPSSPPISRRPSTADNALPTRPALRRPRHQLSSSTGSLYAPGMPSPLSQPPEINLAASDEAANPTQNVQVTRKPSMPSRKASQEKVTSRPEVARSSSVTSNGSAPSSYVRRPNSSGNGASRTLPIPAVPKRPSTAGGVSQSMSGPMRSLGNRSTQDMKHVSEVGTMVHPKQASSASGSGSKRPSTAPVKASTAEEDERSRSRGLFRKKSKDERSPSKKRSWFRFW